MKETVVSGNGSAIEGTGSVAAIVATCFFIALFDGLDINAITFTAPILAKVWGLSAAAMTPAFLATSAGAVVGYIACGPLVARWGQRSVAIASIVLFASGTLATVLATDVATLSALRFATSIGLGAALPVAVAVATSVIAPRHKGTAAILVASGLSAGGVIGGVLGGPLIQRFGWTSIYMVGGLLPFLLIPAVLRCFKASAPTSANQPVRGGVTPLFHDGLATRTSLLWLFSFLVFIDAYALIFWIPSLITTMGVPYEQAPASAAVFSMGGLLGNIALTFLIAKLGASRTLMTSAVVGIVCMTAIGLLSAAPQSSLMLLIFGIGAGTIPCCAGQAALAVSIYPVQLRTTGIGWAAAIGRVGSIFGPAVGGAILSVGWSAQQILLVATGPALCALLVLLALSRAESNAA